jgi:hypothetical protein
MTIDAWPFIIAAYAITILGTLAVTFWSLRAMKQAERDAEAVSRRHEG